MALRRLTMIVLVAMALAGSVGARAEEEKSVEDIIKGLTGAKHRGIGGVRQEDGSVQPEDEVAEIAIHIQFANNSSEISPDSIAQLQNVANALNDEKVRSYTILVEGHTDNVGSDAYNLALSERRAQAVRRYLVEKLGVSASRLRAKGYGKRRPLPGVAQDSDEGRASNRRVVFANLDLSHARKQQAPETASAPQAAGAGETQGD